MAASGGSPSQNNQLLETMDYTTNSQQQTYASITSGQHQYKNENAIIIDAVEGLQIDDYLDGMEKITSLENVKVISKISGGRVILWLTNEKLANELKDRKIYIKNLVLSTRLYVSRNKRVVISNIPPTVPEEAIINALKAHGIEIISTVSMMRASTTKPGRAHILCHRRQFYVKEEFEKIIPEALQLHHNNTSFWTFLSTDSTTCFNCKKLGHIAKACPLTNYNTEVSVHKSPEEAEKSAPGTANTMETMKVSETPNSNLTITPPPYSAQNEDPFSMPPPSGTKRPLSSAASTTESNSTTQDVLQITKTNRQLKKTKKAKTIAIDGRTKETTALQLLPAKELIIENSTKYPLDFEKTVEFLHTTYDSKKIAEIAHSYTTDTSSLIEMLTGIQEAITDKSLKNRIGRIKKRLKNVEHEYSSTEDSSSTTEI